MSDGSPRSSPRDGARHAGHWILADARLQRLLAIGPNAYRGTSLRTALDLVARRGLMPLLRIAVDAREPVAEMRHVRGQWWAMRAIPLCGAVSRVPVAVLGCYAQTHDAILDPPPVGTWEWKVTQSGPRQQLQAHVSRELYDVYGVAETGRSTVDGRVDGRVDSAVDGTRWLDEFVAIADRPAVRAFFTMLLSDPDPELRVCAFTATPPTGRRYALRCAGRRHDEPDGTWLRGITTRQHDDLVPVEPGHLDAVLTLSRDPLWLIDPRYEVVYLSSDALRAYDLQVPPTRYLPEMCHVDDLADLRAHLRDAAEHPGASPPPISVRFAAAGDGWRSLEVRGHGVRITPDHTHVWCRLRDPATP